MVNPERGAGFGIERNDIVRRLRDIHDSVDHQWRGLEFLQRLHLEDPFQLEILHVRQVDLMQQAVALA